jgi:hypothetical protein
MPASAPAEVTAYVRDWIERTYKSGKPYNAIAAELEVSSAQVNNIRDAKRGVGIKLERRFAQLFHRGSVDEVRRVASEFCRVHEGVAQDAYQHRGPALARLKGLLSPDVEQRVRTIRYRTDAQPSELHWIEVAIQEQNVANREALFATAVAPAEPPLLAAAPPPSPPPRPRRRKPS